MGEGQNDLSASSIFKNSFNLRSFICQGIKFGGGTSYMPSALPLPSDDDSVKNTTNAPYALCNSSHRAHCPGCWVTAGNRSDKFLQPWNLPSSWGETLKNKNLNKYISGLEITPGVQA